MRTKNISDEKSQTIDEEITALVMNAESNAAKIINQNVTELHRIADALLEFETINGDELDHLIKGEPIVRINEDASEDEKVDSKLSDSSVESNQPDQDTGEEPLLSPA